MASASPRIADGLAPRDTRELVSWELTAWLAAAAILSGELVVALTYGPLGHHS